MDTEYHTTSDRLLTLRQMPYHDYLQTPEWRRRRNRALMLAAWRCEWPECDSMDRLEVHHRQYDHLGEEPDVDLRVLCYAHHHALHARADELRRVHWRVIRDVINSGPFASLGDFIEAAKVRFSRLRIGVDPYALNEMLNVSLHDVPIDAPDHPVRVSVANDPAHISEAEARALLPNLRNIVRTMPAVRQLSTEEITERHWRTDQRKAYRMVQQLILETAQRVAALEAAIEDVERCDTPDRPDTPARDDEAGA
jgi:hypothetical protein